MYCCSCRAPEHLQPTNTGETSTLYLKLRHLVKTVHGLRRYSPDLVTSCMRRVKTSRSPGWCTTWSVVSSLAGKCNIHACTTVVSIRIELS